MPTDTDRREVARRLRELSLDPWDDAACEIAQCAGIACCNSECHGSTETPECTMALCAYLADLIEPSAPCPHYMHPCCRTDAGGDYIDRDALLALAKVLHDMGNQYDAHNRYELGTTFRSIAARIREALGVEK